MTPAVLARTPEPKKLTKLPAAADSDTDEEVPDLPLKGPSLTVDERECISVCYGNSPTPGENGCPDAPEEAELGQPNTEAGAMGDPEIPDDIMPEMDDDDEEEEEDNTTSGKSLPCDLEGSSP